MPEDTMRSITEGILEAMRAENEGQHFYLMASRATEDPKGRSVFEQLAGEEHEHFEFLKTQYESILATGKPDTNLKLGPRADLTGTSPIFSESIRDRLKDAHYEMTALSVGIQLELTAQAHYRQLSEQATDPVARFFFTELAEWEKGHYRALLRQHEELKESYWASNNFAPF